MSRISTIIPGVDMYDDGRCIIRTFDGREFQKTITNDKVRDLLAYLERHGVFGISRAAIDQSIDRLHEPTTNLLADGTMSISWPMRAFVSDAGFTELTVRTGTNSLTIGREALYFEAKHYPQVLELRALTNFVHKIYETVGERR